MKGLGLFAKAHIPRGTRVIAESAILKAKGGNSKDIVRAFESLPKSQQNLYLELHGYACEPFKCHVEREMEQDWQQIPDLHRTVLAIYGANSFGDVFLLGSRINHSCLPNIHFAYNPVLEKETFHAIRDIIAGEELTITYAGGTNRIRNQRQAELDKWGFQCTCPACEDTLQGRAAEEKRAQLLALDQQVAMDIRNGGGTDGSYRKGLQMAQRMAGIQKSQGLLNRELGLS